ncbi:SpoIIIAH-like family protein [Peribacillus sp. SCS-155]|uniref:SpoIIIAH-like family protein n=1 Tax=Peribacillus sedimenti TaxID=3115297 RepID=UPI00390632C7
MLLKKQTVWLLTMLSLVVVLSVYYLTTPEQKPGDLAATDQKEDTQEVKQESGKAETAKTKKGASVVTKAAGDDDAFEALRMEITDSREKLREELNMALANTELSAEERNKAMDSLEELNKVDEKEGILETLIGTMDYDAALVRIDGDNVNIMVKADKPNQKAADDIIQLVSKEFDQLPNIAVEFQPQK